MKVRIPPLSKLLLKNTGRQQGTDVPQKTAVWDEEETCVSSEEFSIEEEDKEDDDTRTSTRSSIKQEVRFQLDQTKVHYPRHDFMIIHAQWYSAEDFEHFRRTNNFSIQTARRGSPTPPASKQEDHEELSYATVLDRVYKACQQGQFYDQPSVLQKQLQLWPSRSGLEAKVIVSACKGKMNRKERLYTLVAKSQTQTHLSANELSRQCALITRPASLFAQQVAQAANVVVEYNDT